MENQQSEKHNQSLPTKRQNAHVVDSSKLKKEYRKQNINQLTDLIRQSFDVFNFTKTADSIENKVNAFFHVVGEYPPEAVNEAFQEWIRKSPVMPTPHDILEIIEYNGRYPKVNHKPVVGKPWFDELNGMIGDAKANAWFSEASLEGGVLTVKSNFHRDWIKNNFKTEMKKIGVKEIKTSS